MDWGRLERYARWKKGLFRLHALPDELLLYVCKSGLSGDDIRNLVEAFTHSKVDHRINKDAKLVPQSLRGTWMVTCVQLNFQRFIRSITDKCFFLATLCSFVRVYVDWSPYLTKKPPPWVAAFEWRRNTCPHGIVHVNEYEVSECIMRSFHRKRPQGFVSVYRCHAWAYGRVHMSLSPDIQTHVDLIPWFVST